LNRFRYHLLSFLEPSQQYNAGEFVKRTESLIPEIRGRGKVPLVCGGTAFYIRSFLFGLPGAPQVEGEIRARLRELEEEKGHKAVYDELARRDPEAAARIPANDRHRALRALEILEATGRSVYSYGWPRSLRNGFDFLILGLECPREQLYRRIDSRVDLMFSRGLPDEIRGLLEMGYGPRDPGMQGIGYREFFQMQRGCLGTAQVKALIQQNTRRYAKRQLTFFRTIPGVHWLSPQDSETLRSMVDGFLRPEPQYGRGRAGLDQRAGNSA
jgi:tRNA dimethylallyltransferase